jgi:hypothetical protein
MPKVAFVQPDGVRREIEAPEDYGTRRLSATVLADPLAHSAPCRQYGPLHCRQEE